MTPLIYEDSRLFSALLYRGWSVGRVLVDKLLDSDQPWSYNWTDPVSAPFNIVANTPGLPLFNYLGIDIGNDITTAPVNKSVHVLGWWGSSPLVADLLLRWGFVDGLVGIPPGMGAMFEVDIALAPTWRCRTTDGVGTTYTDTGIAWGAGVVHKLNIVMNQGAIPAVNRTVQFFMDDVLVATHDITENVAFGPGMTSFAGGTASVVPVAPINAFSKPWFIIARSV